MFWLLRALLLIPINSGLIFFPVTSLRNLESLVSDLGRIFYMNSPKVSAKDFFMKYGCLGDVFSRSRELSEVFSGTHSAVWAPSSQKKLLLIITPGQCLPTSDGNILLGVFQPCYRGCCLLTLTVFTNCAEKLHAAAHLFSHQSNFGPAVISDIF